MHRPIAHPPVRLLLLSRLLLCVFLGVVSCWCAAGVARAEVMITGIGRHDFTLERGTDHEVTSQRAIRPFTQWMLQRPVDFCQSLQGDAKEACRRLLTEIGTPTALDLDIRHRLKRKNFQLARDQ